ncbi:MAG: hypothetical protein IPQ07_13675 [Myxococcales bacterium]|nr:hypothetical protein [Myxococcales bacterium]
MIWRAFVLWLGLAAAVVLVHAAGSRPVEICCYDHLAGNPYRDAEHFLVGLAAVTLLVWRFARPTARGPLRYIAFNAAAITMVFAPLAMAAHTRGAMFLHRIACEAAIVMIAALVLELRITTPPIARAVATQRAPAQPPATARGTH